MPNGLEKVRAENRLRLVALRDIDEIARQQPVLMERGRIALQPALVLDPALDIVEHDLRQLALGELMQVLDIDHVVDVHGVSPADRPVAFSMAYYSGPRQSSGNRNRDTERAGAVGHALIESDQGGTEPLCACDVKCIEGAKRQIEPPQK